MRPLLVPATWESKSALFAHLDACEARKLIVGQGAEAPRAYYSFSVASSYGSAEIGIISSGFGTDPAAVLLEGGQRMLVGHDRWLTWIDMKELAVISSQRLGGVFFKFLPLDGDDDIVVLHELGVLRVDAYGAVKWSIDTDVVEDYTTDAKGNLILTVMDSPRLVVSLASGTVYRH